MDLKKEMQAQGKSLGKAIVDFVLPESPIMRIMLLGSIIVIILAWLSGGTSADGSMLDNGKFCVAASSDSGKFSGKGGNCDATPQAEKFDASFEVNWQCGTSGGAPCTDIEIQLTGFTNAPTAATQLTVGGFSYDPVITSTSISWSVPRASAGESGSVSFIFYGTESQIMAVNESIASSAGEAEMRVDRIF